jgi:hypothetical protein
VFDHGVAAAVLGRIERGVGGLDQISGLLRIVRRGAGNADGDLVVVVVVAAGGVRHGKVCDRGPNHFADLQRRRRASPPWR